MLKIGDNIPRGTIVLVPFPFTDLSAMKVRPALVVSRENIGKSDVIVVFISSVIPKLKNEVDILLELGDADFKRTGLKTASLIKCRKIATLDRSIVLGELGILAPRTMKRVDVIFKKIFGI